MTDKCKHCGHPVAPNAWKCENCGSNTPTEMVTSGKFALIAVVVVIGLYMLASID